MKQIIALTLTIILIGVTFSSCKKDPPALKPAATTISLEKIDNDLRLINAKYSLANAKKTQKEPLGSARAWATGTADVVTGAITAYSTKELCITGWGGFVCALLTVGSAAVASYATWKGTAEIVGDGNTNHERGIIVEDVGKYTIPNPYDNPVDSIGAQHNAWVKVLCEKPAEQLLTYGTLIFDSSDLTKDQLTALTYDSTHRAYNNVVFLSNLGNLVDSTGSPSVYKFINYECANDSALQNILTIFAQGLSQASDVNSAMAFINDYENYFLNTETGVTDAEKYGLLNGFSIGKYSYSMWYDAYTH